MKKVLSILLITVVLLSGCSNKSKDNSDKFNLEDKYYNKGEYIKIDSKKFKSIEKESYLLYIYNNYCSFSVPCENVFEEVMKKNNIDILSMPFAEFKKTSLYKKIKYAPSVIIVNKGKVVSYLDAESDEDLNRYQVVEEFESWLDKYINLKKS